MDIFKNNCHNYEIIQKTNSNYVIFIMLFGVQNILCCLKSLDTAII